MTTDEQLRVFKHLSLIDMERAIHSVEAIENQTDRYVRDALFRDAVVSYSCPFSSNRDIAGKKGLRLELPSSCAGDAAIHQEIINLRNQIVAHNDLCYLQPKLGPGSSLTVKGYEVIHYSHLLGPLSDLAKKVHQELVREVASNDV